MYFCCGVLAVPAREGHHLCPHTTAVVTAVLEVGGDVRRLPGVTRIVEQVEQAVQMTTEQAQTLLTQVAAEEMVILVAELVAAEAAVIPVQQTEMLLVVLAQMAQLILAEAEVLVVLLVRQEQVVLEL